MIHVIKNIITKKECEYYLNIIKNTNLVKNEIEVSFGVMEGRSEAYHNLPALKILQVSLTPLAEKIFSKSLASTYSYFRMYYRDCVMGTHTDQDQCEYSLTLNLGTSDKNTPYPLYFEKYNKRRYLCTEPGEGIFYQGIRSLHGRERCPLDWYAQVFFHWVEINGPYYDEMVRDNKLLKAYNDSNFTKFLSNQK